MHSARFLLHVSYSSRFINAVRNTAIFLPKWLHTTTRLSGIDSPENDRGFRIVNIVDEKDRRILRTEWDDGKIGRYPYIWLRDCSPDSDTYTISESMIARKLFMRDFDVEVTPKTTILSRCGSEINIEWPCGTVSSFKSEWLRTRNLVDIEKNRWRKRVLLDGKSTWSSEDMETLLPRYSYSSFMNSDSILHDYLESVCRYGIGLLTGVPENQGNAVEEIGKRIGMIEETHFGRVFELTTKSDASNMAYASCGELPLHTDFPSLTRSPKLQMLHMIRRADVGGVNLFVDGFRIAEQIEDEKPNIYRLLTRIPLEYIEEGYDVHLKSEICVKSEYDMIARHVIIGLDPITDRPTNIHFGNAMRSWFYDTKVEDILEVYRAIKVFTDYCYQKRNLLRIELKNGDVVLWANTRLLHGRTSFESGRKHRERTLKGCYFSWDTVRYRVRLLRDKLALPSNQPSA